METEAFFLTFLEGTEEIVKSDRACADVLRWANKMSLTESSNSGFETIVAFLYIGLDSEIKRMVQRLKSTKRYIQFSNSFETYVSEAERAYNEERGELHSLQNQIPELLLQIIRSATNSEAIYSRLIEKHKNAIYEGTPFIVETAKKMQRYLEVTILFLRSLDEANVNLQKKNYYISKIFEATRFLESDETKLNQTQVAKQTIHTQEYLLSLLKSAELITFDQHIPRLTSAGISLLKDIYQVELDKSPLAPTPEEILMLPPGLKGLFDAFIATEEKALAAFVKIGILDTDSLTITENGLRLFLGMVEEAFHYGFTGVTVTSIQIDAKEMAEKGIDEIFKKFEPTGSVIRKDLVAAILQARKNSTT